MDLGAPWNFVSLQMLGEFIILKHFYVIFFFNWRKMARIRDILGGWVELASYSLVVSFDFSSVAEVLIRIISEAVKLFSLIPKTIELIVYNIIVSTIKWRSNKHRWKTLMIKVLLTIPRKKFIQRRKSFKIQNFRDQWWHDECPGFW